jgi:hypothetical protein
MLYEIESYQVGTEDHSKVLRLIIDNLRKHNELEETHDLPLLEPKLGDQSSKIAKSFNRHKGFAPTRYAFCFAFPPLVLPRAHVLW